MDGILSSDKKYEIAIAMKDRAENVGAVLDGLFRSKILTNDEYDCLVDSDWTQIKNTCKLIRDEFDNPEHPHLISLKECIFQKVRDRIDENIIGLCSSKKIYDAFMDVCTAELKSSKTVAYLIDLIIRNTSKNNEHADSFMPRVAWEIVSGFWTNEMDRPLLESLLCAIDAIGLKMHPIGTYTLTLWAFGYRVDNKYDTLIEKIRNANIPCKIAHDGLNISLLPFGDEWLKTARNKSPFLTPSKSIETYDNAMNTYLTASELKTCPSIRKTYFYARYQLSKLGVHYRDVLREPELRGVRDQADLSVWTVKNVNIDGTRVSQENGEPQKKKSKQEN
jgi:hypothetical protein